MNFSLKGKAATASRHGVWGVAFLALGAALVPWSTVTADELFSAKAVATIQSCGEEPISGFATLKQRASDEGVKQVDVYMQLEGIPSGKRAVHIHETGACEPCSAAKGHFDPGKFGETDPDANHPFHAGDLINVERRGDSSLLTTRTSRVTLSPGPLNLFDNDGSAFIVHVNPDTYCEGGEVAGCAGGGRAACGVIKQVSTSDDFELTVSTTSNRGRPTLLDGAELTEDAYVFLSPEYPSSPVNKVTFFVDGREIRTETVAPYDLLGSRDDGNKGTKLETEYLDDGTHVASAVIELGDGSETYVSSQFTVDNDDRRFLNGSGGR